MDPHAMPQVLLLDTFSLFFRAHHALPPMSTSSGSPTGALYGFSALLLKLLREYGGAKLAFALDAPQPTFRHQAYEGYKAERPSAPSALLQQFDGLHEILDRLGAPKLCAPGFEADDVLATLARECRQAARPALVVSGDRDLLQLAQGDVRVLFVGRRGKDAVTYDGAAVLARFGVPAERLPSYVALVGDPSDNLPRVPGIGPRSAAQLLQGVQGCAELFAKLSAVKPERLRRVLEEHESQILLSERLARLRSDVPLPEGHEASVPGAEQLRALRSWFEAQEMKSLLPRVDALLQSAALRS